MPVNIRVLQGFLLLGLILIFVAAAPTEQSHRYRRHHYTGHPLFSSKFNFMNRLSKMPEFPRPYHTQSKEANRKIVTMNYENTDSVHPLNRTVQFEKTGNKIHSIAVFPAGRSNLRNSPFQYKSMNAAIKKILWRRA